MRTQVGAGAGPGLGSGFWGPGSGMTLSGLGDPASKTAGLAVSGLGPGAGEGSDWLLVATIGAWLIVAAGVIFFAAPFARLDCARALFSIRSFLRTSNFAH